MYRLAVDTGTFNRVLHMVEIGDVFKGKLLADMKVTPPNVIFIDLSMTYISGVKDGQRIRMETETLRVGRKMAFLTANIYNQDKNNELVATGKHTKYIL
ncbi:Acyl-coenzyme A thioesterase 13 [Tyrophagus putrescentiae]|nr:Acyl-coenzyme A thioesterase 13 [Tyrophagus putrescentiae]